MKILTFGNTPEVTGNSLTPGQLDDLAHKGYITDTQSIQGRTYRVLYNPAAEGETVARKQDGSGLYKDGFILILADGSFNELWTFLKSLHLTGINATHGATQYAMFD